MYLVHAWANSRVGVKSILAINRMNEDGTEILDDGIVVFVGHLNHPTIEGPKLYKRNGYYYIFAPAGGVKTGWQTVLRSKNIFGPYEDKKVLEQGTTTINGPHQGAWVQTQSGEDWFIHFQDRHAYGRIVHLQPMRWENDWPVIGIDHDKNGIGEPVASHKKPNVGKSYPVEVPQTSDEFTSEHLGQQWQWEANANAGWTSLAARKGWLRFYSQAPAGTYKNLWNVASLMLQKIPSPTFAATVRADLSSLEINDKTGLVVFGLDYSYVGIEKSNEGYRVFQAVCKSADKGTEEETIDSANTQSDELYLRVRVRQANEFEIIPKVLCTFDYSTDGRQFHSLGKQFFAREGQWVGAKIGVFSLGNASDKSRGYADIDWFRVE